MSSATIAHTGLCVYDPRLISPTMFANTFSSSLSRITSWMEEAGLCLAAHKTEVVMLVGSRRMRSLKVRVGGHEVEARDTVKYLGVWVGREYRFGPHVARTLAKTEAKVKNLSRLMPNMGGPSEITRRLLCSVANAQILYAAQMWVDALRHKKYREAVNGVQRRLAIKISSAYRTVSGPAVMVVAGVFPLHLLARERASVAADAAQNKVQAKEETLRTWQQEWTSETRGAWTRRLIPLIGPWYERRHGHVNYWTTQVLTGHGAFGDYLHRFKKRSSSECPECMVVDNAEHTLFWCRRWEQEREEAHRKVGVQLTAENLGAIMLEGPEQWAAVDAMARKILSRKVREDSERMQPL